MSPRANPSNASPAEPSVPWRTAAPFVGAILAVLIAALMVAPTPLATPASHATPAVVRPAGFGYGWTNITSSVGGGPVGTASAGFAYDPQLNGTVLFGGCTSGVFWYSTCSPTNATWLFNGTAWTQLHPQTSPPARYYTMMTYDAADGYLLLFGGNASSGSPNATNTTTSGFFGDTWEFSSGNWHQLHPLTSPSARAAGGMAYDVAAHKVVLYGGESYRALLNAGTETYAGNDTNDTWTFSGGQWTQIFPATNPGLRDSFPMVYDANSSSVVLFGGFTWGGGGGNYGDTWSFSGGNWTQIANGGSPGGRNNAAMAADSALGGLVLFGGHYSYSFYSDTYVYNSSAWNVDTTNATPAARWGANFAYDAASDCLVLFGGSVANNGAANPAFYFNDTWIFGSGCGATGTGGSIGGSGNNSGGSGGSSGGTGGNNSGNNSGGHSGGSGNGSSGSGSGNGSGSSGSGSGSGNGSGNPPPPGLPLSIAASIVSRSGTTTVTVTFTTSVTGGIPGYVVVWKFGDGSYASALPGHSIAHTYSAPGTYHPAVTVTDAHGAARTVALATVVVPAVPVPATVGLLASLSPGVLIDLLAGAILAMIGASMLYLHRRQRTYRTLAQEGAALVRALRETDNSS